MATVYTTHGEAKVTDHTDPSGTTAPDNYFIAWGTDGTTASKSDTALGAEASESRATATVSQPSASTIQFKGTITATSSKTIEEMGVFDQSSNGSLYIRSDDVSTGVDTDDSIEFTTTLEQT